MAGPNSTEGGLTPNKWGGMLAVGLGVLMATVDVSIINVSLPTLVEKLHTDFATIQWVFLSYVLMVTSLMLGVARLGDMFGMKKLYTAGLVVFTLGSLLCGLAPSVGWLIGFRALQGGGAVMMQALGVAIITRIFPGSERGRALGIIGSVVSVGLALGPPLGGILIGLAGWRWIFLVNVPIGLIALVAILRFIPSFAPVKTGQRFDIPGACIMFVTLICYALGMTVGQARGFGDMFVLLLLGTALLGLIAFVITEVRVTHPMLDPQIFKNTLFSLNLLMGLLVFTVLAGTFLFPFFLQLVKGLTTQKMGLLMMIVPVAMGLVAPVAGSLSDRFGPRGLSVIGLLVIVGGCLGVTTLHPDVTITGYVLRLAPIGLGMGIFQSPNNSAIMGAVPRERLGVASGLLALSRTLGQTTGFALMGAIFTTQVLASANLPDTARVTAAPPQALVDGLTGTFSVASCIVAAAVALAMTACWKAGRSDLGEK